MTVAAQARPIRAGDRVTILAGRLAGETGTVRAVLRERGCGCTTVIVTTPAGEWAGKASEVTRRGA